ncbi:secretory carrier-associated membrane protein 2 isoform X2 [Sinocyclocheilus rhinocerous]|uniref:secretory carrier-associated membrane protein 2 isoform X2 n=1 Tax=Sinocyclocheilus rhinocerous TaxID=307959 RepID=UPI0007B9E6B2|nr:PREDICTED: secretory carrier-associated membrane protein 2-like isoform X2 [Sinocyclocheilus rhinocerous]
MSGFDSNPFEDPVDVNPFQDPSVTQVTSSGIDHIESFSPFPDGNSVTPAVLQPSVEPSPKAVAAAAQGNLLKQQEELERKAAELERREQELQSRGAPTGKPNNWPPLPKFFPIKPCFYQDFSEEIPQEHQRLCKMIYYLWMWQCVTLFLNVLACLAEFTTNTDAGVDFGLSILWFILFAPCSFLCWFRPVYKAFRSDSSFNFFFFFFVFLAQIVVSVIQSVGIPRWGNSGWISAIAAIGKNKAVGVIMMVVAAFFTATAALSVVLLKMVHSHYRRTGANFQKAQQEFSQGVITNRTFQTAAANAATTAAQSSLQRN